MDTYSTFLLDGVLTTYVMVIFWLTVIGVIVYVSRKTRLYGILSVAAGVVPTLIFYIYKIFNVWESTNTAILYSRLAGLSIGLSLTLALLLMRRSIYNESERPPSV